MAQNPGELSLVGHPPCHDFLILLSWCGSYGTFQRCLGEPSGVIVCCLGTCVCCSGGAGYRRWKSLIRPCLFWALVGWSFSVYHEGFHKAVWVRSNWLTGEHLICSPAGTFNCPLQGPSSWQHCKSTELLYMHLMWRIRMYGFSQLAGMVVAVDLGSPSSSGAVIRKQLVVGCILLWWFF